MSSNNLGLQACWTLNDASQLGGETTIRDISGNNHNGVFRGTPTLVADDTFGTVFQFDGSNDYVEVSPANIPFSTGNFTMAFWVKSAAPATNPIGQILYGQGTSTKLSIALDAEGQMVFAAGAMNNTNNLPPETPPTGYNVNNWNHWAFIKNASANTLSIYLNGHEVASGTSKSQTFGALSQLYIGALNNQNSRSNFFAGKLAKVRVYDQVLSAAQILSVMQLDQTANTTFNRTNPLEFSLRNASNQSLLLLASNAQNLQIRVRNTSTQGVVWEPATGIPSANNHHLHVQFRPEVLDSASSIAVVDGTNWAVAQQETNGMMNLYVLRRTALTQQAQQDVDIDLTGFRANLSLGDRGTLVRFTSQQMHYTGAPNNSLQTVREEHLQLLSGSLEPAPLAAQIVGANQVVNDGVAVNSGYRLIIRATRDIRLTRGTSADASSSKFVLSFLGGNHPWALATNDQISNIQIRATAQATNPDGLQIERNTSGEAAEWTVYFQGAGEFTLAANQSIALTINNIVTENLTGTTYMSVAYENVPEHPDHLLQVPLQKSPLVIGGVNGGTVGIGTSTPRSTSTLNIYRPGHSTELVIGSPKGREGGFASVRFGTLGDRNADSVIQPIKSSGTLYGNLILNPLAGRVGIGANNPTEKLHVNGNIRIDGGININGVTPFEYRTYHLRVDNTSHPTGYSSDHWVVAVVGFEYTINGLLPTRGLHCRPYVRSNNWFLRLEAEGPIEYEWTVSVLAIRREIVRVR